MVWPWLIVAQPVRCLKSEVLSCTEGELQFSSVGGFFLPFFFFFYFGRFFSKLKPASLYQLGNLCCYSLQFPCRSMDNGDLLSCTAGGYMLSFTYWCLLYCLPVNIWMFSPSVLSTDQLMHRSVNYLNSGLGFICSVFSSLFLSHTCSVIMLF